MINNIKYAKLKNGRLNYYSGILSPDKGFQPNPSHEELLAAGYLPVKETPAPETKLGFRKTCKWVQNETAISREWTVEKDVRPMNQMEMTMYLLKNKNTLKVDNNTALRMMQYYPDWKPNIAYTSIGSKVKYDEKLWKLKQEHTSQTGWEPENVPALWEQICETHDGYEYDPIPYEGNMALTEGLYYTQDGLKYRCTRNTEIAVYHPLNELVGLYIERV